MKLGDLQDSRPPSDFRFQTPFKQQSECQYVVVEDEPNIRSSSASISAMGATCEAVGDGQRALARVELDRFDLLVLDV
jgi:CheY-like chemotaxis protein